MDLRDIPPTNLHHLAICSPLLPLAKLLRLPVLDFDVYKERLDAKQVPLVPAHSRLIPAGQELLCLCDFQITVLARRACSSGCAGSATA